MKASWARTARSPRGWKEENPCRTPQIVPQNPQRIEELANKVKAHNLIEQEDHGDGVMDKLLDSPAWSGMWCWCSVWGWLLAAFLISNTIVDHFRPSSRDRNHAAGRSEQLVYPLALFIEGAPSACWEPSSGDHCAVYKAVERIDGRQPIQLYQDAAHDAPFPVCGGLDHFPRRVDRVWGSVIPFADS